MTDPNVLVLVMDTARFGDIRETPTEAIDSVAEEGTDFTNASANAPWSLPSHASMFTGQYSSRHGAHATHKQLDESKATLAELFSENGYETVGVSNNTWISGEFGFARGFETFYKTWQYVQSDTDLGGIARTTEGIDQLRSLAGRLTDGNPVTNLINTVYGKFLRRHSDDGARQTTEWLADWLDEREDSRSFFCFVNYLEPHLEYRPPEEFAERFLPEGVSYEEAMEVPQDAWGYIAGEVEMGERDFEVLRALYRAEIAYLDERIGELREALEESGEWEDTVVVITGDHGENIGDHGLMDHQYCLYETLLHVPMVVSGGAFDGGGEDDRLVQLTDLAPTLLDAAGIEAPEARERFQGVSFHPDSDETREHAIAEYMGPQPSMEALEKRVGTVPDSVREFDRSLRSIRDSEHKLVRGSDGLRELYHLGDDPDEERDLADERPDVASELGAELDDWLDSFERHDASGSVSMSQSTQDRLEDLGYLQ
ncbi:sulfatase [Halalkalicoccus tibetensis]|uniref:Sulfatase n=1 Tax=Halalkalicoccus tibetensis TaxID=175632 RepID=A0ABD5V9Z7_9EURY